MGAITLDSAIHQTVSLGAVKKKTKKMSPSQKRYAYAVELGETIREIWIRDRRKP
jgi:hypothetical protein